MKIYAVSIGILLACISTFSSLHAQANLESKLTVKGESPVLNQKDEKGLKTGWWLIDVPARMGDYAFSTFGIYNNNRKFGPWYKLSALGDLISIETFKNDVLNGESKYFENGRLAIVGNYRGLNPDYDFDTIAVLNPMTGLDTNVVISTDKGYVRHGLWRFYDTNNGRLVKEQEYQVGNVIFEEEYAAPIVDSNAYKRRMRQMPHNQSNSYKPPRGRRSMTR